MVKQATARSVDIDPIDRLEEKIKLLVGVVTRLRSDHAKAVDDNSRLAQEIETLHARLAEAEGSGSELDALRHEREAIRQRVSEMLSYLETI